jgi:hypothetical protein
MRTFLTACHETMQSQRRYSHRSRSVLQDTTYNQVPEKIFVLVDWSTREKPGTDLYNNEAIIGLPRKTQLQDISFHFNIGSFKPFWREYGS